MGIRKSKQVLMASDETSVPRRKMELVSSTGHAIAVCVSRTYDPAIPDHRIEVSSLTCEWAVFPLELWDEVYAYGVALRDGIDQDMPDGAAGYVSFDRSQRPMWWADSQPCRGCLHDAMETVAGYPAGGG